MSESNSNAATSPNVTVVGGGPKPINPFQGGRKQHRLNADNFMGGFDAAGEDAAEEAAEQAQPERPRPQLDRPGKRKAKAEREPEPEPEDDDETPPGPGEDEDDEEREAAREDDDEAPAEREEEDEESVLPPGKGSRENPLTLKDIPKDKFIKLKVDGKTQLVNLAEAIEGTFIRPESFHRLSAQVKSELVKGMQVATEATKRLEALQNNYSDWISDPEQVLTTFLNDEKYEQCLYKVLNAYLEILQAEKADPEKGLRRRRARDEKRVEARQRELDERDQRDQRTRADREKMSQLHGSWQPGIDAGLQKAGFPEWEGKEGEALREEVGLRLNRRMRKKGTITAQDWEDCIVEGAKAIGAQPATAPSRRPTPAPRREPREPRTERTNGRDEPFSRRTFGQTLRNNPTRLFRD